MPIGDEIEWLLKEGSELLLEYVGISHSKKAHPLTTCPCKHWSALVVRVHRKTELSANFSLKRTVIIPIPLIVV